VSNIVFAYKRTATNTCYSLRAIGLHLEEFAMAAITSKSLKVILYW